MTESLNSPIPVARTRAELISWREDLSRAGKTVGFVPTMGALHDGHLSLIKLAQDHTDVVASSIFVNPAQFGPNEDFETYPRAETSDLEKLADAGCALAYCPAPKEIYPPGDRTRVLVTEMSHILEGAYRPHFFEGVATVVSRLFVHVRPDVAVFGEKDYQQLQILRRMTTDLGFSTRVIGGPTVREPDGLAMSSRNAYLSAEERKQAAAIFAALSAAKSAVEAGAPIEYSLDKAHEALNAAGFSSIDYITACDAHSLVPFDPGKAPVDRDGRLLLAAWMGTTRLIDNLAFKRVPASD